MKLKSEVALQYLGKFICESIIEVDKTIQAEKYETERLKQEKQKMSEKLRNDPELQRYSREVYIGYAWCTGYKIE